ncbi:MULTISPECIES: branched-chain amino acid aminotransferase [unclassified Janthinobacterium]|uniref:branched-chain amino acid aminotransferase n=1 Tax=unclassified Janthinobacterium TaxID=2610881 RepID=UPI000348011C|nr:MULTISPECIES: branched-chain amino acid aminotransferase [unclassified Janthinobacterium]MEC5163814.1 branched-chain amino acid aminotransferase [Janthinobacterium sp. CG_S6]
MYLTYFNNSWTEGNTPLFGAMDHSVWLGSSVFDGARSLGGRMPDLRLHLERVIRSAERVGLACPYSVEDMEKLVREGVAQFPPEAELYIRPLVFGTDGLLIPLAEKSGFALTLFDAPMPPFTGFSACLSSLLRPDASMAPTDAKASSLYANTTRALREAQQRGFDNAVVCDSAGQVAEFATANLFLVTPQGKVVTPAPNGTFLSGITRARVIALLALEGVVVEERTVLPAELDTAVEIFNTGNYGKVSPCVRYQSRTLAVGPVATLARDRYMAFAAG